MQKFELRAKAHVRKVFRVRRNLIATKKGFDTNIKCYELEKLERLFNAYPYASDLKMAKFVFNHSAELAYLTPGQDSSVHRAMIGELNGLLDEAKNIIAHQHEYALC